MTSPKSFADKHAARYDLKRSFIRLIPPAVISLLFSVLYFIIWPLSTISAVNNGSLALNSTSVNVIRKQLVCALFGNSSASFVIYGIFAVIMGVIFAFWAFLPIMRKSSVNFFFSSGLNRKTYFKNRAVASIVLMIATTAVPIIIDIAVNIRYFGHADFIVHQGFFLFLEHFTYMLVGFSLMSVSMTACFTVTESLFFGAGLIWAPTVYVLSFEYLFQNFLRGYTQFDNTVSFFSNSMLPTSAGTLLSKLSIINPLIFGSYIGSKSAQYNMYYSCLRSAKRENGIYSDFTDIVGYNVGYDKVGSDYIIPIIIWLVLSLLFIFVAKKLLDKRKLENTALHSSNSFVTVFVSLEASVFAAAFMMPILTDFNIIVSQLRSLIVGLIIGVIVYFVFMCVSRRKIIHGVKLSVPVIVSSVGIMAISVICINGGFGYSTYAPDIKDIDYATVNSEYIDASGVMSNNQFDGGTLALGGEKLYYGNVENSGSFLGKFNTEDSIKKIEKIQKYAYDNRISKSDEPYVTVNIKYVLKNGNSINREYDITKSDISLQIIDLTESPEYRNELEYIMSSKRSKEKSSGTFAENEQSLFFSSYSNDNNVKNSLKSGNAYIISNDALTKTKIDNTPELRDAILKDIETVGYKKLLLSGKNPLGAIKFEYDNDVANYIDTDYMTDSTYYIWDDMVNTVNYIKSIQRLSAFSDYSGSGEISYVTVTPLKNKISDASSLTSLSVFESDSANSENYYEMQGNKLDEKDVLETYDGKKYTDKSKTREIFNASSMYSLCKKDGFVVLVKFKNGTYLTKFLTKENAQKLL